MIMIREGERTEEEGGGRRDEDKQRGREGEKGIATERRKREEKR